jgi:anaerobic selenocysteine-containing dehydrogenase
VPLAQIKQYPHGHLFPDPEPLAAAKAPDWPYRLELGHAAMLRELKSVEQEMKEPAAQGTEPNATLQLLLVSRREHATYNSVGHRLPALRRRRPFNPAYLNPADARRMGVSDGTTICIDSGAGSIRAVVQCAEDVRPGVVSLAHGFEARADEDRGASTAVLVDDARGYDPISGLPRMSAIPVTVRSAATVDAPGGLG